jgi:hypothetical protein
MLLRTTASQCRRRADAGRDMQLHAVSASDRGRVRGWRLFPKESDFSHRGYAQSVRPLVGRWAQRRISLLSRMWLDRILVSGRDTRSYRYLGWLFYRSNISGTEGRDLGGAQAELG